MPPFVVIRTDTYRKADFTEGRVFGLQVAKITATDGPAAIDAAPDVFGAGGRFVAFPAGAMVAGLKPESRSYGPSEIEP